MDLTQEANLSKVISQIKADAEVTRRANSYRRYKIYKDGGKEFLLEQIRREFNEDAVKEMRLAPINLLKKIVNKKSSIYKKSPIRKTAKQSDQKLMEYYIECLKLDQTMQKFNRYYNLDSNVVCYTVPIIGKDGCACLRARIVPAYLYSLMPNEDDRSQIDGFVFSTFTEEGRIFQSETQPSATGRQGYNREPITRAGEELIAANSKPNPGEPREYLFWDDQNHVTADEAGKIILLDSMRGMEQIFHELSRMPIVNLTKDRDDEPWASQGEDVVDLALAIQSGWTDLLTVAKHQGFSVLTVISEEAPTQMKIGLNSAVWLKQNKSGPTPSMEYKSSGADLTAHKDLLMELLGLLLSTNDMNPKSIAGALNGQNFNSGFQALIEMSDTIEAREEDKPILMCAEKEQWEVIAMWHNQLYQLGKGAQGGLCDDAYALGAFSDEFDPNITYIDPKPVESTKQQLEEIQLQRSLGLIKKVSAYMKLNPGVSEEQAKKDVADIADEMKQEQIAKAGQPGQQSQNVPNTDAIDIKEEKALVDQEV